MVLNTYKELLLSHFSGSGLSRKISTEGTIDNIFILITSSYCIVPKTFVNEYFPVQLKKDINQKTKPNLIYFYVFLDFFLVYMILSIFM